MNFKRTRARDEPEINLVAFIDVLLVVLIFLMLSTTFARLTELKVNLPSANAQAPDAAPRTLAVVVAADGRYLVNQRSPDSRTVDGLTAAMAAELNGRKDVVVVVSADAGANHQSVINVMDAARRLGLKHLTFAAQGQPETAPAAP